MRFSNQTYMSIPSIPFCHHSIFIVCIGVWTLYTQLRFIIAVSLLSFPVCRHSILLYLHVCVWTLYTVAFDNCFSKNKKWNEMSFVSIREWSGPIVISLALNATPRCLFLFCCPRSEGWSHCEVWRVFLCRTRSTCRIRCSLTSLSCLELCPCRYVPLPMSWMHFFSFSCEITP